ncbi:MAG: tetratricopeptide repeat protein [Bacteroidales bacterium]|nr:tetratricopeptide repeat protein [Bacteroidales bacterium]MDD4685469.1 tetratricopeptide repeat protein [Bacteroidales bacterium]
MKKLTLIIILLFISLASFAKANVDLFEKGNAFFNNKNYEQALKTYLMIESKDKVSSDLYYNIGNTYFRLNDYTNSILYYERGLKLKPNDENLNINLRVAKSRLKGDVYIIPDFFLIKWWKAISNIFIPSTWTIMSIILLIVSSVIFVFYYFSFNKKIVLFYCFILSLLLLITSVFAGFSKENTMHSKSYAIVFDSQTYGKDSPDINSTDKIRIYKGQKIKIIDKNNDWIKVKTEDGKEAWIENKDVVII